MFTQIQKNTLCNVFVPMLWQAQRYYFYGIKHNIRSERKRQPMYAEHYISADNRTDLAADFEHFLWKFCKRAAMKFWIECEDLFVSEEELKKHLKLVESAVKYLYYK